MNRSRLCLLFISLCLFVSDAFATPWNFEITPYIWALNMNGHTSVGPATLPVDQTFSDIFKHLNVAGMLYATAHKDRFGLYFNGIYAVISDGETVDGIHISGKNKFGVFGAGISYIAYQNQLNWQSKFILEPYAGARYTLNNTTINLNNFSFSKNVNWTDPVLGLRMDYIYNKKWSGYLIGDIGGTNTTTHYSYSAGAFVSYQPPTWRYVKTYLGYRLLDQHYQTGHGLGYYNWNVKLFGPVLGFGITF
jgi:hypothetical protein